MLLVELDDGEAEGGISNIEYFTDCYNQWYIWDWDLEAAYYIDVAPEEDNLFYTAANDYWDGAECEEDYYGWESEYQWEWDCIYVNKIWIK